MPNVLNEYLVKLGFNVDSVSLGKFSSALRDASKIAQENTTAIAGTFLKWQSAIVGGFATAGAAALSTVDRVAMADQSYRLFALRMFTTTNVARELKISLDALGEPLENIAWDPELAGRFSQLVKDQKEMTKDLGPDFEKKMRSIRDLRFEFTRAGVEFQYLTMNVVKSAGKIFGVDIDDLSARFHNFNNYVIGHLPEITD